jgi:hypothetical protein
MMLNIYQGIIINVAHYLCEMFLLFKLCAQTQVVPLRLRKESNFEANKLKNSINVENVFSFSQFKIPFQPK